MKSLRRLLLQDRQKLTIVDHYDSFTNNLRSWLQSLEPSPVVEVIAFDDQRAMTDLQRLPTATILSAGPHCPRSITPTINLLKNLAGRVPILGICLGFQAICATIGLTVTRSQRPLHGRLRKIYRTTDSGLLDGLPASFSVAAYNSLAVPVPSILPRYWQIAAVSVEQEVQVIEDRRRAICGLQFHPESFLDRHSRPLLRRWLANVEVHCDANFFANVSSRLSDNAGGLPT